MTAVLVDSNVLLDVITEDRRWFAWSAQTLEDAADRSRLVINPIIYAEVSVRFFTDRGAGERAAEDDARS